MKYLIEFRPRAAKDLRSLEKKIAERVLRAVRTLENDLSGDVKRLKDFDPAFRLRIGEYRVLFDVEGDHILIYRIKHRSEVHKR